MKKSLILLTLAALAFSCGNTTQKKSEVNATAQTNAVTAATRTELQFSLLENYFLKNTVKLADEVNLVLSKDSASFYNKFGMARTMGNAIVQPDFAKNTVVAIACQSSDVATAIAVERVISTPSGVDVYVKITRGEKRTFTATPVALVLLPKLSEGTPVTLVQGEVATAKAVL